MTDQREAVARVERVETVPIDHPFSDEETPPIWRVVVGEYCADFDYEQAARNFANAILAALPQAREQEAGEAARLADRLDTEMGNLDDDEDRLLNEVAFFLRTLKPMAMTGDLQKGSSLSVSGPVGEDQGRAGMDRDQLARILCDHFAQHPYDTIAFDRADLRLKIRTGAYDINEPTWSDCLDAADVVLARMSKKPENLGTSCEYVNASNTFQYGNSSAKVEDASQWMARTYDRIADQIDECTFGAGEMRLAYEAGRSAALSLTPKASEGENGRG